MNFAREVASKSLWNVRSSAERLRPLEKCSFELWASPKHCWSGFFDLLAAPKYCRSSFFDLWQLRSTAGAAFSSCWQLQGTAGAAFSSSWQLQGAAGAAFSSSWQLQGTAGAAILKAKSLRRSWEHHFRWFYQGNAAPVEKTRGFSGLEASASERVQST